MFTGAAVAAGVASIVDVGGCVTALPEWAGRSTSVWAPFSLSSPS